MDDLFKLLKLISIVIIGVVLVKIGMNVYGNISEFRMTENTIQIRGKDNNVIQTSNNYTVMSIGKLKLIGGTNVSVDSLKDGKISKVTIDGITVENCDISDLEVAVDINKLKDYCEKNE